MKDPAFLFYTKDFQSGTQDMSCEEVGAYLRLLMYQHQHGAIPTETERLMRITGIFSIDSFNSIWEVIKDKFSVDHTLNQMVNQRLNQEMNQRSTNKPKKIASAVLAGLISANNLSKEVASNIKQVFDINDFIYIDGEVVKDYELIKSNIKRWFYEMVNQMVNNIANANADVIIDLSKGGMGGNSESTQAILDAAGEYGKQCMTDESWKQIVAMQEKIPLNKFRETLWEFCKHCATEEIKHPNLKEFKSHFKNWSRKQDFTPKPKNNNNAIPAEWLS